MKIFKKHLMDCVMRMIALHGKQLFKDTRLFMLGIRTHRVRKHADEARAVGILKGTLLNWCKESQRTERGYMRCVRDDS